MRLAVILLRRSAGRKPRPHPHPVDIRRIHAGDERRTENVILVTLDRARTQEIFGGLDLYKRYWAPTPRERREKLSP